ncbi:MAG: DinB family protein [Acidobacteriota bacterium]
MSTTSSPAEHPAHPEFLTYLLHGCREFFERSTRVLTDEHGGFAPHEGLMTVTQQVAHVADTFDWFRNALVHMEGFDMDFEAMEARIAAVESLAEARQKFEKAHGELIAFLATSTPQSLAVQLPADDPVMPGAPRAALVAAVVEHTAHHRGVLTGYARSLGLVPPMPYAEMPG